MTSTPSHLPGRYFSLLLSSLEAQGVDTPRLLQLAGIEPACIDSRNGKLKLAQVHAFLEAAHEMTGRTDLGFEVGRLIKLNSHDILGYGMLSCRDLDHVLRLTSRHYDLINPLFSMRYRRTESVGEAIFTPIVAMPVRTLHFVIEAIGVSVQNQIMMMLGSEENGFDIRMGMPVPAHAARYAQLLPARFYFDDAAIPAVTLRVEPELLKKPLPLASELTVAQVEAQLAKSKRRPTAGGGWGDYVTMLLRETQGLHVSMKDIALRMNISARTIDRNLKKENVQFRELLHQVRFERARELLAVPHATVSEVAESVGFSHVANFSRAFRRRFAVTPTDYQALLAGDVDPKLPDAAGNRQGLQEVSRRQSGMTAECAGEVRRVAETQLLRDA